jgi:hypothetical protein
MNPHRLSIRERLRVGWRLAGLLLALFVGAVGAGGYGQEPASRPARVTIRDEQTVIAEPELPLDPVRRIQFQPTGIGVSVRSETNQTLHLSHFPTFNIDGRLFQQGQGGRAEYVNRPLPLGKGRKNLDGFVSAYNFGDLHITVTVRLTPTKPPPKGQGKRRLDSVLVHYLVENKGQQAHQFGVRVYMDTYVIDNDGCLFAAPTVPNKILDGTVLKEKQLPPYVQLLQRPNLANPGFVAHLTLDLGARLPKPDRVVLTRHGSGFNTWDMPAVMAMGDSALGIFWEPKPIKPGGKREIAYGYGQGVVISPENEGRVQMALGGSFEPGKRFSVTAYVTDPAPGQFLTLELPDGMAFVQGKALRPVPPVPGDDQAASLVVWEARVLRAGDFAVRVRSSTGVTQGKHISIAPIGS